MLHTPLLLPPTDPKKGKPGSDPGQQNTLMLKKGLLNQDGIVSADCEYRLTFFHNPDEFIFFEHLY